MSQKNNYQANLIQKMKRLRVSGKHADWSIHCGDGRQFAVHKAVVCSQSVVLAKTNKAQKRTGQSGPVQNLQHESDTVDRMLWFMYACDYDLNGVADVSVRYTDIGEVASSSGLPKPDLEEEAEDPTAPGQEKEDEEETSDLQPVEFINQRLISHVKVFAIADYYDVGDLKALAVQKFSSEASKEWAAGGFASVVREIYTLPGRLSSELREVVLCVALQHIQELVQNRTFMRAMVETPGVEELVVQLLGNVASGVSVENSRGKFTHSRGQSTQGRLSIGWFGDE